jgi:DNA gyrase/topoisomerase IV subunit B
LTHLSACAPVSVTLSVIQALVLYSVAEHQLGHASSVRVGFDQHAFSVADDGRGHAISRQVEGAPYLDFIYRQLDYPFEGGQGKPIQLQGLGMSLLTRLCAELCVCVRKPTASLTLRFENGSLTSHEFLETQNESTGNEITARIDRKYGQHPADLGALHQWLLGVLAAHPSLCISLNGHALTLADRGAAILLPA